MSSTLAGKSTDVRTVGDSFAVGVLIMLFVSVAQRLVGLVRGLGFCHFLSDVELGHWALANSFFVICVPIAVLGLPGSFGRFVENFRSRGQLGDYFYRIVAVSLIGLSLTAIAILAMPDQFAWLLFRESNSYAIVMWCTAALISATIFSFINELVSALREVRIVSLMQLIQSLVFAVVGLSLLSVRSSWWVLLPSFSIACGAAIIPGLFVLRTNYRGEFRPSGTLKQFEMWNRILPYAAALWVLNFLSNMFEVSDRYMLLHLIPGGQEAGQAMVGQYHCGRILPNLLTSLALMLSGILLPFVSADWEAGKTEAIVARLRQVLQSLCIGFLALSIAAMSAAPILFHYGFKGRYELAESILPLSLLQATLASLFIVAQVYLLCAEKGRQLAGLMVVGLAANLLLNWWFIQHFGLYGAVTATALANLFTLSLLFWRMAVLGCNLGMGTMVLCLAPLSIVAGPVVASLALLAIIVVAGHTNWLLSDADRRQIDASLLPKLAKLGLRLPTLWP